MLCYVKRSVYPKSAGRVVTAVSLFRESPRMWNIDAPMRPRPPPGYGYWVDMEANLQPITGPGIESEVLRNADLRVPS